MKITKEKFNKLKQLDRIEFRQKQRIIQEKNESGSFTHFLNCSMLIIGYLVLLLGIFLSGDNAEAVRNLINIFPTVIKLLAILLFIGFCLDVYYLFKYRKEMFELISEYFEVKTK